MDPKRTRYVNGLNKNRKMKEHLRKKLILQVIRKGKETYRENEMRSEKNDLRIYNELEVRMRIHDKNKNVID